MSRHKAYGIHTALGSGRAENFDASSCPRSLREHLKEGGIEPSGKDCHVGNAKGSCFPQILLPHERQNIYITVPSTIAAKTRLLGTSHPVHRPVILNSTKKGSGHKPRSGPNTASEKANPFTFLLARLMLYGAAHSVLLAFSRLIHGFQLAPNVSVRLQTAQY